MIGDRTTTQKRQAFLENGRGWRQSIGVSHKRSFLPDRAQASGSLSAALLLLRLISYQSCLCRGKAVGRAKPAAKVIHGSASWNVQFQIHVNNEPKPSVELVKLAIHNRDDPPAVAIMSSLACISSVSACCQLVRPASTTGKVLLHGP